jgi:hypothetical protein
MINDTMMRRVLAAAALFNLGGAVAFAVPSSMGGRLMGLPADVPTVYRALVAFFVLLFGAMYAWLARQERIDRAMVAMGALGKAGAFAIVAGIWMAGQMPGRSVIAISGDLVFAMIFGRWLIAGR